MSRDLWAYRFLLRAYPGPVVREHGEEMVQIVRDRRALGGDPWWRLWPWVLADIARSAPAMRWEALMIAHRAPLVGLVASIAVLAVISDGLRAAAPVLAGCLAAAFVMFTARIPTGVSRPHRSWARWTVSGVTLLVVATTTAVARTADGPEFAWALLMLCGLGGFCAISTGAVLLVDERWARR